MSHGPFRFLHAADLHLEQPPVGLAEVPDYLRPALAEAGYAAAGRVFEAAISERVEFVVLSGDVLNPRRAGPRGVCFLLKQFERLTGASIAVYWAGGRVDAPKAWPAGLALPKNVRVFAAGRPQEFIHRCDGEIIARLIGASRSRRGGIRAADFDAADFKSDADEPFTVAVAYGKAAAAALGSRAVDYWALGGRHSAHTLVTTPHVAHYPGSPQGRSPSEIGPHGCTLVEVDDGRHVRTTSIPTDAIRWQHEPIALDDSATQTDLESLLHQRAKALHESHAGLDVLVTWSVDAAGPLAVALRHGKLATELLESLRKEFGFHRPAVWSVSLAAEPPDVLSPELYEQETILGDYLRQIRLYQMNPDTPIDLGDCPCGTGFQPVNNHGQDGRATLLGTVPFTSREQVLREAAILGLDLLSGEESFT